MTASFPTSIPTPSDIPGGTLQSTSEDGRTHRQNHNDEWAEIVALATKLGTGTDVAAANEVLKGTAAGATAFATIVTANIATGGEICKRQLDYVAATDVMNAVAMTAGVFTAVNTNQSFTVDNANSTVLIAVRGNVSVISSTANNRVGSRIMIDSATPYRLGGGLAATASEARNALAGSSVIAITGLSAASHTVNVEAYTSTTGTGYCRPATNPNDEILAITVVELKR